jgi:hypothetical protein
MEQWQIDAVNELLETSTKEVEPGERVYISSEEYGTSRYHMVDRDYDGVRIEQIEMSEKWSKRITLSPGEVPAFIKTLLLWHLDERKVAQERKDRSDSFLIDDGTSDLDDHPF